MVSKRRGSSSTVASASSRTPQQRTPMVSDAEMSGVESEVDQGPTCLDAFIDPATVALQWPPSRRMEVAISARKRKGYPRKDNGSGIVGTEFLFMLLIDAIFYCLIFLRDYSSGPAAYNRTITHFVLVLTLTDVAVLGIPGPFRHWYLPFRATGTLQILALTYQCFWVGIDGPMWLTWCRCAVGCFRIAHSVFLFCMHARLQIESVVALVQYLPTVPGPWSLDILNGFAFLLFGNIFSSTHYNWGEPRVDAPLAAFQAADSLNAFWKLYILQKLCPNMKFRAGLFVAHGLFLAVQWPLMPEMYSRALRPYIHIGAELGLFAQAAMHWPYL